MWGDRGGCGGTCGTTATKTSVTCRLHPLIHENRLPIEECLSNLTCRTVVCACRWAYERIPKEIWSKHRKNCAKNELEVKHPEKNRAHLPARKVILCILPKEFEFFTASLGTTGDEGGGGTRDHWDHRDHRGVRRVGV